MNDERNNRKTPDAAVFGLRGYVSRAPEERFIGLAKPIPLVVFEVTCEVPAYRGEVKKQVVEVEVYKKELRERLKTTTYVQGQDVLVCGSLCAKERTSAKGTRYTILSLRAEKVELNPGAEVAAVSY